MKRNEVELDEEELTTKVVKDFVDDIETRVNQVKQAIEEYHPVHNPDSIKEAFDILEKLSEDLY